MIEIRKEIDTDIEAIYQINIAAFEQTQKTDLINALRVSNGV